MTVLIKAGALLLNILKMILLKTMKIAILKKMDWNQNTVFCECMDAVCEKKWENKLIKQTWAVIKKNIC